jgi:hypothetical protein
MRRSTFHKAICFRPRNRPSLNYKGFPAPWFHALFSMWPPSPYEVEVRMRIEPPARAGASGYWDDMRAKGNDALNSEARCGGREDLWIRCGKVLAADKSVREY